MFFDDVKTAPTRANPPAIAAVSGSHQGCFRYTAIATLPDSHRIVAQFRKTSSRVNVEVIKEALTTYTSWIPPTIIYDESECQLMFAPYAGECFAPQEFPPKQRSRLNALPGSSLTVTVVAARHHLLTSTRTSMIIC